MFLNNFWLKIGKEKVEMAYDLNYLFHFISFCGSSTNLSSPCLLVE